MRQIVLDTETTGLSIAQGNRIIEIGCLEMVNRRLTGREFHRFVNPERDIEHDAEAIHGISREQLATEPRFADIAEEFLDFIRDSELIIHNAEFDLGFLDYELGLMKHPRPRITDHCTVLDTLALARELHPGQRNSLDALCKRYEVDASKRDVHGALIDSELLALVYLAMTGGQSSLLLDDDSTDGDADKSTDISDIPLQTDGAAKPAWDLAVVEPTAAELAAHEALLAKIRESGACAWDID